MFDAEIEAYEKFKNRTTDVVMEREETETQVVEDVVDLHNDL